MQHVSAEFSTKQEDVEQHRSRVQTRREQLRKLAHDFKLLNKAARDAFSELDEDLKERVRKINSSKDEVQASVAQLKGQLQVLQQQYHGNAIEEFEQAKAEIENVKERLAERSELESKALEELRQLRVSLCRAHSPPLH